MRRTEGRRSPLTPRGEPRFPGRAMFISGAMCDTLLVKKNENLKNKQTKKKKKKKKKTLGVGAVGVRDKWNRRGTVVPSLPRPG